MAGVTQMQRILQGTESRMRLLVASVREASEISNLAALVRACGKCCFDANSTHRVSPCIPEAYMRAASSMPAMKRLV